MASAKLSRQKLDDIKPAGQAEEKNLQVKASISKWVKVVSNVHIKVFIIAFCHGGRGFLRRL